MNIAIIFWGLSRSLKYTHRSIIKNIYRKLKENNINFDVYFHTYKFNNLYNNTRSRENYIKLNFEEYSLLKPDFFIYDNIKNISEEIDFNEYKSNEDPWKDNYKSMENFILALYSKKKVTEFMKNVIEKPMETIKELKDKIDFYYHDIDHLERKKKNYQDSNEKIKESKIDPKIESLNNLILLSRKMITKITDIYSRKLNYNYCIFIRPDVRYLNEFQITFFDKVDSKSIAIPNFGLFSNFNDRMFISTYENALLYGYLFDEMLKYSKENKLHSETFHYFIIKHKFKLDINLIKFYFNRVRANGLEITNDYKINRKN